MRRGGQETVPFVVTVQPVTVHLLPGSPAVV